MRQTTCYLILHQMENLTNIQNLVAENFPDLAIQTSQTVNEMLDSTGFHGNGFSHGHSRRILITDSQAIVDGVNQSGAYVPVVFLDRGEQVESSTQFAPNQVTDIQNSSRVIEAISQAKALSHQFIKLKSQASKLETLADRERMIIAMAAEGVPNKTIATRLGISIKTVEKNRRVAYSKLSVASTAEMASLVTFGRFFSSFAQ